MDDTLYRVEGAVTASASGDLTWDCWTLDSAVALGLAGRRNPLGLAVVRYLSEQTTASLWFLALNLSTVLINQGEDKGQANQKAMKAVEFWNDMRCRRCHGRGHAGMERSPCTACGGTGERPVGEAPGDIRHAVAMLLEAAQWMEGQLRSRLAK